MVQLGREEQRALILRCKNIRIFTDIMWRVFRILTEPVPYTFLSAQIDQNNLLT